ncbi:AAA domain-containing protein [Kitasatospora sp. NRRL B-11411]|uniref:AAA domain-containing protein n=1 Tax=Kitasatospora sp. NRRL B-11411 TaxID=1463822 RepID=UPI001E2AE13E|nr:AAA domain-containing protein [Kitasatospora sp. NRRL B-11411]
MEKYGALIDRLFCRDNAQFEGYTLFGDPQIVVPERLVRATLHRRTDASRGHDAYQVTIFDKITGLAGELWEHTARNLLRVGALNHPALPQIAMGKFVTSEGIAFTLTRERGEPINVDHTVAWASRNTVRAFEHFSTLLDALNELHSAGIIHRNLTAASLNVHVLDRADPDEVAVVLSRFEMSTLIGNVIRTVGAGSGAETVTEVRQFYTAPAGIEPERHLAYLAPELHSYLFDEHTSVRRDWVTTDVYGLAATVWEWFCGRIPDVLPEPYAEVRRAAAEDRKAALARLQRAMVSHLASAGLPPALANTLRHMMEPHPDSRWTAYEAAKHLEENWQKIRVHWAGPEEKRPRLVAFMPDESVQLYEERKWIQHSPATPAGQEELRFFLQNELSEAVLVHSARGALGYATGPEDRLKEAQWVLIGHRAVWFCAVLYDPVPMTTTRKHFKQVLVIKYFRDKDITMELVTAKRRRKVESGLQLIPFRPGQNMTSVVEGRHSWKDLQEAVRGHIRTDTLNEMYLRSLQFLLNYQRMVLQARSYPFRVVGAAQQGTVTIEFDEDADADRRHSSPMLSAYALDERRRPRFADFFAGLDGEREDRATVLNVVGRGSTREPYFGGKAVTAVFREYVDPYTIRVSVQGAGTLPKAGWIRHVDDSGTGPQLDRQERGLALLRAQPLLIESLRAPFSFDLGRGRWIDLHPRKDEVDFDAVSRKLIERMLGTHPFFALQGPPGSGKSTLTAAAVRRNLEVEQGARILVTSQSNHTLDGLARKLIQHQSPRTLILRETAAEKEDEVRDELVRAHTLTHLTRSVQDASTRLLAARLARKPYERSPYDDDPYPPGLLELAERWWIDLPSLPPLKGARRELAEQWLKHITSNQLELSDRIRSGASVVLATCSIAATVNDGRWDPKNLFDWVIVEEAAKAWSTEIIVPLVLGVRWTLIGDHLQLGPHRQEELEAFLDSLHGHPDPLVALEYEQKKDHLKALRLFEQIFADKTENDYKLADSAVGRIEKQFRMDKTIAEPVSRAFYQHVPPREENGLPLSFLRTEKHKPHDLTEPDFLRGRPLVWVDTGDCDGYGDEPRWRNEGEVRLVDWIAQSMLPTSAPPDRLDDEGSLAVLTPYKAQLELLGGRDSLRGREYTVHSFQGREADRVIVSLVRSTADPGGGIERNVGHVGRLELINVLMSRAKRLLVVVGDLRHFATYGGEHWARVIKVLRAYGTIVPADEVGPR